MTALQGENRQRAVAVNKNTFQAVKRGKPKTGKQYSKYSGQNCLDMTEGFFLA